ncbi:MAG: hydrogenase maturation nickel metallochaperone HypA [Nitrospirae bacterium]|nr:hydrogenase maturation nickel metallochaperone HypA [Nitrospirota bacterium]
MHEWSVIIPLLRAIESAAAAHGASRVVGATVVIAPWSGFSEAHLREHFALGARGSIAEGARLTIEVCREVDDRRARAIALERIEVAE